MINWQLWLRWSWRDLRARWVQVAAIALIIALGTGIFAGMTSNKHWRELSYDASYDTLNMYDLRLKLTEGSFVEQDRLLDVMGSLPHADWIAAIAPRLRAETLVEANAPDEKVMVAGEIVGIPLDDGQPALTQFDIRTGRALTDADNAANRVLLEFNFAKYYDMPAEGTLKISGDTPVDYVGQAMTPEFFFVMPNEVMFLGEASYAAVFTSLESAQALTGREGLINDLVLTLADDADRAVIMREIDAAMAAQTPNTGYSLIEMEDDTVYNAMYGDLESDDQIMKIIAYLFLAGATFGAFNLASRIVEAQRRQIGIGMSLGVPRTLLALRPLLVGLQIALLGTVFGLMVGMGMNEAFKSLFREVLPLPVWETPFVFSIFLQAAALGIIMPLIATLIPVWRAIRVQPVDAIRTGHLVAKGGGLAPWLAHLPLPGRSLTQMPLRNLMRSPRRTVVTLLGVAMAITTLIAMTGMLDSFIATIDAASDEILQDNPDRTQVTLDMFYAQDSELVQAISEAEQVGQAIPALMVGGELLGANETIDVSIELLDMDNTIWKPTLIEGAYRNGRQGILLAEKAAKDLRLEVGDTITVKHPQREGLFDFSLIETDLEVTGIHASPLRFQAYMDISQAEMMGLAGITNELHVTPAEGVTLTELKAGLFPLQGVASVMPFDEWTRQIEDQMSMIIGIMGIVVVTVLVLAFLIAFNSTSINVDERAREIATMFAFGLRIRSVTRMPMVENLITGILGTLLGVALGYAVTVWSLNSRIETMMPDIGLTITVSNVSLALAVLVGVIVVALTPLLSIRKMARMDLPSNLRVME